MPVEIAPGVYYYPRAETGLLAGAALTMGAAQEIGRQHYSTGQELGRDDLAKWVREIDRYHREHNGWLGFGYSFAVGRDADPLKAHIFEGRGWGAVGAHTSGHNHDLGVCFLGNDDPGYLDATPGVRRALRALFETPVGGMPYTGRRPLRDVHGHRETYSTSCPGDELQAWVRASLPLPGTAEGPAPTPPTPIRPPRKPTGTPAFPFPAGHYLGTPRPDRHCHSGYYSRTDMAAVETWQRRMRDRGWSISVDGRYGDKSAAICRAFQAEKHLKVDGLVGPATWAAAWTAPVTR